ncbi:MAG: hypothetical protein ACI81Y_002422 [Glaciecola sp.]|jgi:hypothetical protein
MIQELKFFRVNASESKIGFIVLLICLIVPINTHGQEININSIDNDGIFDVLESGGADANFDGIIGSSFIDANANGLSSIVDPNESGAGLVLKDSDTDGNIDSKESESDGCNDVIEAGFLDGDNNGYLGTGTIGLGLNVNSLGIVTP